MADPRLRGVSPVLAVPFHEDGSLDDLGFVSVVDHVLRTGVTSALLFGLASEFHKLSDSERHQLTALLLERTNDRPEFAAICSVTDHATWLACRRAEAYEAAGADAINVLPPHFLAPSREAVVAHLDAVVGSVSIPVIVQHAPGQTGSTLVASDLRDLASRHPHFAIVKVESVPPGPLIADLKAAGISSFVGQAGLHLPEAVAAGAIGVQPGCSMIPLYQSMWSAAVAGDQVALREQHAAVLPVLTVWMSGVERIVQAEKSLLHRSGVIASDHCRAPGVSAEEDDEAWFALVETRLAALRAVDAGPSRVVGPPRAGS
ncbi:4-hydroxy-tetrahydrodipicolinate synthase [soil metagenome]